MVNAKVLDCANISVLVILINLLKLFANALPTLKVATKTFALKYIYLIDNQIYIEIYINILFSSYATVTDVFNSCLSIFIFILKFKFLL